MRSGRESMFVLYIKYIKYILYCFGNDFFCFGILYEIMVIFGFICLLSCNIIYLDIG